MKTRTWVILLAAILAMCVGLSLLLWLPRGSAASAKVYSQGKLLYTLDLAVDREVTVTAGEHENVITVREGKIAVTAANCPDGYCIRRGFCSGGVQIVCLPHRLVIEFAGETDIDGVTG